MIRRILQALAIYFRSRRVKRPYIRVNAHKSRHAVTEIRDGGLTRHWRESGR